MKISLCGSDGSGKTCLAEYLAGKLDLPLIPDHYRAMVQEIQCQTFFLVQNKLDFFERIIHRMEEDQQSYDSYVFDRSALDCWVIWQRWCWNHYPPETTTRILHRLTALQDHCNKTIVLSVNPHAEYDGFRFINPHYAEQYDALIQAYISQSNTPGNFISIKSAQSIEDMIQQIETNLF